VRKIADEAKPILELNKLRKKS